MRKASEKLLARAIHGSPTYLGRVSAGTAAKNNTDTTAFAIPAGSLLLIIPSAAVKVKAGKAIATSITTANGVPLATLEKFYMLLGSDEAYLEAITDSSTSNVDVWRLE